MPMKPARRLAYFAQHEVFSGSGIELAMCGKCAIERHDPASRQALAQMVEGPAIAEAEFHHGPVHLRHLGADMIENVALCGHPADEAVKPAHCVSPAQLAQRRQIAISPVGICGVAQAIAEEIERHDDQNDGKHRKKQPWIERDHADAARLGEQDAPAGYRRPQAEPEEAQRRLAQDHAGNGDRRRRDQMRHEAGNQVPPDDAAAPGAHQLRGQNIVLLAQAPEASSARPAPVRSSRAARGSR